MAVFTSDGIEPHDLRVKYVAVEKAVTGIRNSSIKMEQVRSRRSVHVARAAGRRNHNKRKIPFPRVTQPFNTSILFEDCRNAEIFHHTLPRKPEVRRVIVSENIHILFFWALTWTTNDLRPNELSDLTQWSVHLFVWSPDDPSLGPSGLLIFRSQDQREKRLSIRGCWKASRTCSTTDCAFDYN